MFAERKCKLHTSSNIHLSKHVVGFELDTTDFEVQRSNRVYMQRIDCPVTTRLNVFDI